MPPSNRQEPSVAGKYYHSLPLRLPSRVARQILPVRPSSSPLPLPSCCWRHPRRHRPSSSAYNRAAGKAVSVSFEFLWVSVRVCVSVSHTRALPCGPRIASKMFEKSSTWILIPINKRMGYDVDRRPRTDRNKEILPIEPTPRKEQGRKKEKAHPAHTRTHKSHRGIRGGSSSRVLCRPLPSAHQPAPAPRKGTSHGSILRMIKKDSSAARLAGPVGPVSQEQSWRCRPQRLRAMGRLLRRAGLMSMTVRLRTRGAGICALWHTAGWALAVRT